MHFGWRKTMKIFDLHCDTLGRAIDENKSLISQDFHVDIEKGIKYDKWVQCFAIFIPDEIRGDRALELFKRAKEKLESECEVKNSKIRFLNFSITNFSSYFSHSILFVNTVPSIAS